MHLSDHRSQQVQADTCRRNHQTKFSDCLFTIIISSNSSVLLIFMWRASSGRFSIINGALARNSTSHLSHSLLISYSFSSTQGPVPLLRDSSTMDYNTPYHAPSYSGGSQWKPINPPPSAAVWIPGLTLTAAESKQHARQEESQLLCASGF